jgi:hypothetical protein
MEPSISYGYLWEKLKEEKYAKIKCPNCGREVYEVCAKTGKCLVCLRREGENDGLDS